ncbi:MAG: PLP-dependent aminotransferase family protein [Acetobacteraceae bacterium]|nr:PLP-dependent aminotransferase family protein [Acetobacteraceae bacterium]
MDNLLVRSLDATKIAALLGWEDAKSGPLFRRLADGLRRLAEEGYLVNGSRLPPERQLAHALSISRNTVTAAYALLRTEGWIEARQGSSTRIATSRTSEAAAHRADTEMATLLRNLGSKTIDLTLAAPDAAPIVSRSIADPSSLLPDPSILTQGQGFHVAGHPRLRTAVAAVLSAQGLPTRADEVMVTNGSHQALSLLMTELTRPGMGLAIEEVAYPGAIDLAIRSGVPLHLLPLGKDGADVDAFRAVCRRARVDLAILTPDFQNPTGALMPAEARRRLVRVAQEEDVVLIDDRTHADLSHGEDALPPLASFDDQTRVVTIGGMSKLYWGGLRLGWIRARSPLINRLIEQKSANDLGTSMPIQIIAAELLQHHHDATRTWRNEQLRRSLDALESALLTSMPAAEWRRPPGGPNLWMSLPGTDAREFSRRALAVGVAVIAGPLLSCRAGRATDRIRVPFYAAPATLTEAVTRLARCWTQMTGR